MNWSWSEAGLCWYLNRDNGQSVVRVAIRTSIKVAVVFILAENDGMRGHARFSIEGMSENDVLNNAAGMFRDYLTTVAHEMLTVKVMPKE